VRKRKQNEIVAKATKNKGEHIALKGQ